MARRPAHPRHRHPRLKRTHGGSQAWPGQNIQLAAKAELARAQTRIAQPRRPRRVAPDQRQHRIAGARQPNT
jgi:hypothetical protein